MSEQPITNVEDAVRELGALPVPAGSVPSELESLRARVAELEHTVQQMCDGLNGHDCPPPNESPMGTVTRVAVRLMEAERQVAELEALELGDLDGRVSASCGNPSHPTWLRVKIDPRGCPWCEIDQAHQDVIGANLARHEEEQENVTLRARIAELEALTPAAIQTCRVCGAGYSYGEPCQSCQFRARMAAELQARGLEDPHDSPLHHAYKTPRDLPETGGA